MNKKLLYESPTIDVFTLQSEGVICVSDPNLIWGSAGEAGGALDDGGTYNL